MIADIAPLVIRGWDRRNTLRYCALRLPLQATAVERRERERRDVELVEAAHVDCHHLAAVRRRSAREGAHPALRTEQVVDRLLAELVVLEIVRSGAQREMLRRHEGPERAALLADRAVAGDDAAEVGGHLEADLAAMAAAGIGLGFGHPVRRLCLLKLDALVGPLEIDVQRLAQSVRVVPHPAEHRELDDLLLAEVLPHRREG